MNSLNCFSSTLQLSAKYYTNITNRANASFSSACVFYCWYSYVKQCVDKWWAIEKSVTIIINRMQSAISELKTIACARWWKRQYEIRVMLLNMPIKKEKKIQKHVKKSRKQSTLFLDLTAISHVWMFHSGLLLLLLLFLYCFTRASILAYFWQ